MWTRVTVIDVGKSIMISRDEDEVVVMAAVSASSHAARPLVSLISLSSYPSSSYPHIPLAIILHTLSALNPLSPYLLFAPSFHRQFTEPQTDDFTDPLSPYPLISSGVTFCGHVALPATHERCCGESLSPYSLILRIPATHEPFECTHRD